MKQNNTREADAGCSSALLYAQEVLRHEAAAVNALADDLDGSFNAAVSAILDMGANARLVLCGIGKTGFVGMKISATFASIGIPSFFLHPAEAIHGDLGRVLRHDLVMLLSNSGETPEIIRIIPGLKKIGAFVIALTSVTTSLVAQKSDLVLRLGKTVEAGPLGLAPTTSTTAMLALGDALAMTVSKLRPISREQFALFHPGGNLGRTLMLVNDVMRRDDELCVVRQEMIAREVIKRITETKGRPGAAAVVDAEGVLRGVFTDGDLRRLLNSDGDFLDKPVTQVMGKKPKAVPLNVLADEALKILSEFQIDQVFVVDERKAPVGMVDIQDLVRWNTDGLAASDY